MKIPLQRVRSASGNSVEAGYDETTQTMRVKFKNGTMYDYRGVDPQIAAQAFLAPSFGLYLNQVIEPCCPAGKVKPGGDA